MPITAGSIILSVIHFQKKESNKKRKSGSSEAFTYLSSLLPGADELKLSDKDSSNIYEFELDEQIGEVIKHVFEETMRVTKGESIWGRDLITSALLCNYDQSLRNLVLSSGMMFEELQDRWYQFLISDGSSQHNKNLESWWSHFNVPLPDKRRTRAGYLAESTESKDKLNIAKETSAIAAIVSDENTLPPLSLGLIGDWGSGKSFFMTDMQNHIRNMMGKPGYCKNIAIVKFNAWHVSDANLWASIVDHIFTEVWSRCQTKGNRIDEARIELNKALKEAKGALYESENQLEYIKTCLKEALKEQDSLNKDYAVSTYIDSKKSELLSKVAAAVGWNKPLESFKDIEKTVAEIKDTSARFSTILRLAFKGRSLMSALTWVSITIILACLLYLSGDFFKLSPFLIKLTQIVATTGGIVGTILSSIAAPLSKASKSFNEFETNLEITLSEYEKDNHDGEKLINVKQKYRVIDETVLKLREKVATLEQERITMDPFERLTSFIKERSISDTYRSQQGIISLVRRDFEKLSELMKEWRNNNNASGLDKINPVDRIIFYIDDLDRCSPQIVVQTLEAIHLLLALELFVVIVGVDSRWLLRSLDVHYNTLLSSQENEDQEYRISTPQNYLEKIFQITYAVTPMSESGYGKYIDYLAGFEAINPKTEIKVKDLAARENTEGNKLSKTINDFESVEKVDTESKFLPSSDESEKDNGVQERDKKKSEKVAEVNSEKSISSFVIRGLSISTNEKAYLKRLYPFILTPRIAKKIVNVYRIFKAKTPLGELDNLEKEEGRHRAILMLLSILFNYPQIAEVLFKNLAEQKMGINNRSIFLYNGIEALANTLNDSQSQNNDLKTMNNASLDLQFNRRCHKLMSQINDLRRLSEIIQKVDKKLPLKVCENEALEVSRYSLTTGQVWHTWQVPKRED